MDGAKVEKISISVPSLLLAAVDDFAPNRSKYFSDLAENHLRSIGKLTVDPVASEMIRFRELVAARGLEVVRAKLDELVIETVQEGAA